LELGGPVLIKLEGEARFGEDLGADLEASVAILVGREFSREGFSGGVIGAEDQTRLGSGFSEPGRWGAIEEEEFSFPLAAFSSAAVFF